MFLCNSQTIDNMKLNLEKTGIVYNPNIDGCFEFAQKLQNEFENSSVYSVFEIEKQKLPTFVIVAGGDGTILRCARHFSKFEVPIFGFNLGHLGFLAQAQIEDMKSIVEDIKNGKCKIENRTMLEVEINGEKHYALNDFVIKGAIFSRTSTYELFINETHTSSYLADGIIISTPTGSTAYSLSAGGPVISPNLSSFSIVPICPHTLNARPIVVSSDEIIKIKTKDIKTAKYKITLDGQKELETEGKVVIKKGDIVAKLLLLDREQNNFYNILREKFSWGTAPKRW